MKGKFFRLVYPLMILIALSLPFTTLITPYPAYAATINTGTYGPIAYSGQLWNTATATEIANGQLNWIWAQPAYPYSSNMQASAVILKNANKRLILRTFFADDPAVSANYTNWTNFNAGGSTAVNQATAAIRAQIDSCNSNNLYGITISEEEPTLWGGNVSDYITAYNAIYASLHTSYPNLKIIATPMAGALNSSQLLQLNMTGLMYYSYTSDLTSLDNTLDTGYATAAAKNCTLDLYTLIHATTTPTQSWEPDSHVSYITAAYNVAKAAGYPNIGFYSMNDYNPSGASENILFNNYAVDTTSPEWQNNYQHKQAMLTILNANITPPSNMTVISVYIWQNVTTTGDYLVVAVENVSYATLPTTDVGENYIFRFMSSNLSVDYGSTQPYAYVNRGYGRGVVSWYFPAASAPPWNGSNLIRIEGKITSFTNPPVYDYAIPSTAYSTASTNSTRQDDIAAKILSICPGLESAWGSNYVLTTQADTRTFLSSQGEAYLTTAISGLKSICPQLFLVTFSDPVVDTPTWTNNGSTSWETRTSSTPWGNRIQGFADLLSINYLTATAIPILILCIALLIIGAVQGNVLSGMMNSCFVLMPSAYYGWFPPITMILISFFSGLYLAWHLFGKSHP